VRESADSIKGRLGGARRRVLRDGAAGQGLVEYLLVDSLTATCSGGTWSKSNQADLSEDTTYIVQATQSDQSGNVGSGTRTFKTRD
jgi:hypothetical protein